MQRITKDEGEANSLKVISKLSSFPKVCPLCQGQFSGRNIALEKVAAVIFARNAPEGTVAQSFSFITHIPDDTGDDGHDTELDSEAMEDVTKWLGNC